MRTWLKSPSPQALRKTAIALLLLLPLLAFWNLFAESLAPKLQVKFGRRLSGVVAETPVPLRWSTFADGSWQKYATTAVTDAIPVRPLLIRLSNNIRLKLFGAYGAYDVVAGDRGHLIERSYVEEYCRRDLGALRAKAGDWIPKLKALQDAYTAHGHVFVYFITPSKAAHLPELFVHRYPCPSAEQDRTQWLPVYAGLLRDAGINFVDAASLTHSLKGKYNVDLFPQGGVHWNAIAQAEAANALIAGIDRQGLQPPLPRLVWSYEITNVARGSDRDLLDLLNVMAPNARYPTAKVTFDAGAPCPAKTESLDAAFVGGSFIPPIAQILIRNACLRDLRGYNYLYRGVRGGEGYKTLQRRSTAADVAPLANADIMILEENESVLPGSAHASELYRVITGK